MNQRRSPEKIAQGLQTTSHNIRALAKAGYDCKEIKTILGIRYQHVRDVLLRSGITSGLRRDAEAEREEVEVDAAPAPCEDIPWKVLNRTYVVEVVRYRAYHKASRICSRQRMLALKMVI